MTAMLNAAPAANDTGIVIGMPSLLARMLDGFNTHVFSVRGKHHELFGTVIRTVAVNMMHFFSVEKGPTQYGGCNQTMLVKSLSAKGNSQIAMRIWFMNCLASLVLIPAFPRTESRASIAYMIGARKEVFAASFAGAWDSSQLVRVGHNGNCPVRMKYTKTYNNSPSARMADRYRLRFHSDSPDNSTCNSVAMKASTMPTSSRKHKVAETFTTMRPTISYSMMPPSTDTAQAEGEASSKGGWVSRMRFIDASPSTGTV